MPLLSILLPTYNGAAFLDEQMASILAQTADDFELLLVDDGSSDGTPEMLARYAAQDRRVRLIDSRGNIGQVNRLNQLMGLASGEFYAIADQDDIWALDKNERLLAGIGDKGMAFGRSDLVDRAGQPVGRTLLDMLHTTPDAGNLEALLTPRFSAHGSLLRRSWLSTAALGHPLPFDWLIGLEAVYSTGVAYIDDAIVRHRIHGGNQMNRLQLTERRIDTGHIRRLLLYRRAMRLRFWLVLNFLGQSAVLSVPRRTHFRQAADQAYASWYSKWRGLGSGSRDLRRVFATVLEPYASSPNDLMFFRQKADVLAGGLLTRASLRELVRRHRTPD